MASKAQLAFARQVYAAAVEKAKTEIDPAFVTAQAMLETGWGLQGLSVRLTSSVLPGQPMGREISSW